MRVCKHIEAANWLIYFKMLVYNKSYVIAPSFLFTVGTATRVILMLLALHGLTSFLGFCISLKHGMHEGLLLPPILFVRPLNIRWFSCSSSMGLTILDIATTVHCVVHLVGTAVSLAMLAKLLITCHLRDLITQAPRRIPLEITLGFGMGCGGPTLCLELLIEFFNHDLLNILF
jgi:hypothetical protein